MAEVVYPGPLSNQELFQKWATEKCVPLVREITFENAEVSFPRQYNVAILNRRELLFSNFRSFYCAVV